MLTAITDYLNVNAFAGSYGKGLSLFKNGKVGISEFNPLTGLGSAIVQGSQKYFVTINFDEHKNKIETNCTCPYDWGGLCKHEIAFLLDLRKKLSPTGSNNVLQIPIRRISRSIDKFKPPKLPLIKDYQLITIKQVELITQASVLSLSNIPPYRATLKEFQKGKLIAFKLDRDPFGYYAYDLEFIKKDTRVEVLCSCGSCIEKLCVHGFIMTSSIANNKPDLLSLLDEDGYHRFVIDRLKDYGITTDQPDKYASLELRDEKFALVFKPKYEGLIPISEKDKKLINSHLVDRFRMAANPSLYLAENEDFNPASVQRWGFGMNFSLSPYNAYGYVLTCLTAKYNKNGDALHSHFTALTLDDLDERDDLQRELMITANQANKLKIPYHEDEEYVKLSYLRQVMPYLRFIFGHLGGQGFAFISSEKSIYVNEYKNSLRKTALRPVKIGSQNAVLKYRLTNDDEFIELQAYLTLDKVDIPFREILQSGYFVGGLMPVFNETLYLLPDIATYIAIEDLHHGSYKTLLSQKENFLDQIVMPLSINFEIDMSRFNAIKNKKQPTNPDKRLLYISDMGEFVIFRPFVAYDTDHEQNILDGGDRIVRSNGQMTQYGRDRAYENTFNQIIKDLHPKFKRQFPDQFYHLKFEDLIRDMWFIEAFEVLRKENIDVLGLDKLRHFRYSYFKPTINTHLKSGQDWFDLEVQIAFGDNHVSLAQVKKALLKKQNFVTLADGTIGLLPEEWLHRFSKLFRYGEVKGDEIKISSMKFMVIDELFNEIADHEIAIELRRKKEKLASFSSIKNIRKPKGIKADLRDYQKEGLNWLSFLNEFGWGGILADDMGLGKTLQILSFLVQQKRKTKRSNLIVVPTSLIFNWENEINKFCPDLDAYFYYGTNREKDHKPFSEYDVVITSYGLLVNDIEILRKYAFNYIVLDESQSIKNTQSLRFKAACLLKGKHRIAMTGTPIENNTFDLYAQMHFVNPGLLGSALSFKEKYSTPIDREGDAVIAGELKKIIHPFIIRRTKEQVAKELPPKTEEVLFCTMEADQRKVYDTYRNKYRDALLGRIQDDGLEKSKIYILEGLTKLRQICDSPAILSDEEDYGAESVKIKELMRNIKEKTGNHKIIVFSQFVTMLKLIEKSLQKEQISYEYLDGQSSRNEREQSVQRFQTDDLCRVFLISLKAGGTGLNLTAADYVFLVDPWWNPAVENQAIDRCYRIGQDKKVFAYRMICKDTVEEKIVQYQQKKQAVAADIIQAEESFMKQLSVEDIRGLFD